MIIVVGLVLLVAAVVVGVAAITGNTGAGHAAGHFSLWGFHYTGSTGLLLLYGIIVGAVAIFGAALLLTHARRTSRRGTEARRGLAQSRAARQEATDNPPA
jgi:hypothetical protein